MSKKQQLALAGTRKQIQGAMALRRGPAVDHVASRTRDKWERQADEAARRILHGERNVARTLTPAPASSVRVPLSPGDPLPAILRTELEEGFGADLSAVRIHRDQHAAAAAHFQHAAAFASGRDIFFNHGSWAPWSPGGRELLAHEIAHSVQQAGRVSSQRTLRVSEVTGETNEVQRKDAPIPLEDFFKAHNIAQPPDEKQIAQTITKIVGRHREASDHDDASLQHCDAIEALANVLDDRDQLAAALIKETQDPAFPKSSKTVTRLYFDCFKALGLFEKAMAVIGNREDRIPEQTALLLAPFYVARMRGLGKSASQVLRANKVTSRYWKSAVIESFRIAFYSLYRSPQDLDPQGKFHETISTEWAKALRAEPLAPNERALFALSAFLQFDGIRMRAIKNSGVWGFAQAGRLKPIADQEGFSPEVAALCEEIDAEIVPLAKQVAEFWDRVEKRAKGELANEGQQGDLEAFAARRKELARTIASIKGLKGYEASLKAVAQVALRYSAGGLPSEATFRANLNVARRQLVSRTFTYDQGLIQLQRDLSSSRSVTPRNPKEAADRVLALGTQADAYGVALVLARWLADRLDGLDGYLNQHVPTGPAEPTMKAQTRKDWLLRYFQNVARGFGLVGAILGYHDLQEYAARVEAARAPGLNKSYVALFGTFEPLETDLRVFRGESFPPDEIHGFEPLTGKDIQILIYDLYYSSLADRIAEVLDEKTPSGKKRRDVFDPYADPVINQALKTLTKFKPPRRLRMPAKDVEFYVRPQDEHHVDTLIASHPAVQAIQLAPDEMWVVHGWLWYHQLGVVVWIIPNITQIVSVLSKANLKLSAHPSHQAIFEALKASYESSLAKLNVQLRAASINLRRSRTPDIAARWHAWDRHDIRQYGKPYELIKDMLELMGSLQPPQEQKLQIAAMMLELAPALNDSLMKVERYDVLGALLPHLIGVSSLLADKNEVAEIKKLELGFPEGELESRKKQLQELQDHFADVHKTAQASALLGGNVFGQTLFAPGEGFPVIAGDLDGADFFAYEGVKYQLLKVYNNFRYVPTALLPPSGIDWKESDIGKSELYDASGARITNKLEQFKLFDIKRNGVLLNITGADDRLLTEITYAVNWAATSRLAGKVGEFLEEQGERMASTMGTAIQVLQPELAPEIAWIEIASAALRFLGSPEFQMIMEVLDGSWSELLSNLWSGVKRIFSIESLWDYLLFDTDITEGLGALKALGTLKNRNRAERKSQSDQSKSAIVGVFTKLEHAAEGVGRSFIKLHDRVNVPVRKTHMFVVSHPSVALILRLIADNLYRLTSLRLNDLGEGFRDFTEEKAKLSAADFLDNIKGVVERLNEFELPEEVVAKGVIVDMIVTFIIDRLPAKYRYALKALKEGLEKAGLLSKLTGFVAEHLSLDPNILWRGALRSELEPHLKAVVGALVEEINTLLTSVPFLRKIDRLDTPNVGLQFAAGDFPEEGAEEEVQPKTINGADPSRPQSWDLHNAGSGSALDADTLKESSLRLGHDFSHVRLHKGAEAQPFTTAFHAEALTSGSHVFLRPELTLGSHHGRETLYHELGHVLQQTGPRPLGEPHSALASWGESKAGLNFDPRLEAEADHIAAGANGLPSTPVTVTPGFGIQPRLLTDIVANFFKNLGDPEKIKEHVGKVEKARKSAKTFPPEAKLLAEEVTARRIGQLLIAALNREGVKVEYAHHFGLDPIPELIGKHVQQKGIDFADVIPRLVGLSIKKSAFVPSQFLFELEDYLLGKTGIALKIKPSGDGKTLRMDFPFLMIKVEYIHLLLVGSTSGLWNAIVENTFSGMKDDDLLKRKSKAWLVLQGQPLALSIFDKKKVKGKELLVFSKTIVDRIEAELQPKTALSADTLPIWKDYIKTEYVPPDPKQPNVGQIGLRLGLYGNAEQKGNDRDAHHTEQFLLLEYFNNQKDKQPFPHSLSLYPGVEGKGKSVNQIGVIAPDGKLTSEVLGSPNMFSGQISGRAPQMPTLLLSKHTHWKDVHITPKPDDTTPPVASQANTVHDIFRAALGDYADIVTGKTKDQLEDIQNQQTKKVKTADKVRVGGKDVTSVELSKVIFKATIQTYRQTRNDMEKKLTKELAEGEKEYYRSVLKTDTTGQKYDTDKDKIKDAKYEPVGDLTGVLSKTKEYTRKMMEDQFGFPK